MNIFFYFFRSSFFFFWARTNCQKQKWRRRDPSQKIVNEKNLKKIFRSNFFWKQLQNMNWLNYTARNIFNSISHALSSWSGSCPLRMVRLMLFDQVQVVSILVGSCSARKKKKIWLLLTVRILTVKLSQNEQQF